MNTKKKKKGRPRKEEGRIEPWQFTRENLAMCGYDEARTRGEKHSVAVAEAVSFVKQFHPGMSISESEVRRILALRRPRTALTILRIERSVPTEQEIEKWTYFKKCLAASRGPDGPALPPTPEARPPKSPMIFKIRSGERPDYPRSNRKNPKN